MASVKRLKKLSELAKEQRPAYNSLTDTANAAVLESPVNWERSFQGFRSAMVLTSRFWLSRNKYIILYVNPSEMAWTLGRRETVTKTAAGAIRNAWRNRYRGTYYDEPTVNITFQTGNIMPGAGIPDRIFGKRALTYVTGDNGLPIARNTRYGENADEVAQVLRFPPIPPGLGNFYDFLELIDQPMLSGHNTENRHILLVRTRAFPRMRLEGYFTQDPISFTESATNANLLTWTATFMVYDSTPKFYSSDALRAAFADSVRSYGGMGEIVPKGFDLEDFQRFWEKERGEDLDDRDLPYQGLRLDSKTERKKKKAGLTATPAGKTATPKAAPPKRTLAEGEVAGVQPGVNPAEAQAKAALASTDKIFGEYQPSSSAAGQQPGTQAETSFKDTEYWTDLQRDLQKEIDNWDPDKGPPPTANDLNQMAAYWMRQNVPAEDLARYEVLLHRLENP